MYILYYLNIFSLYIILYIKVACNAEKEAGGRDCPSRGRGLLEGGAAEGKMPFRFRTASD